MPQKKRPFICDCNEPAVKYDSCHNPVCARCLNMESIRDMYAKKGLTAGVVDDGKDEIYKRRAPKKRTWINEPDNEPILLPDALKRIEDLLNRAGAPLVHHGGLSTMVDS